MTDKTIDLSEWVEKKEAEKQRSAKAGAMVMVDERRLAQLTRRGIMLAALVKREGRVRFTRRELDAITERCKLDLKVQEDGDVVLSFVGR